MPRRARTASTLSVIAAITLSLGFAGIGALPAAADSIDGVPVTGTPSAVQQLVDYNGALYMTATNGTDSVLFAYDGAAFTEVPGSPLNPSFFHVHAGVLYFNAFGALGDSELWSFDGVTFTEIDGADDPSQFITYGGALYFAANPSGPIRLYTLTGTTVSLVAGSPEHFYDGIVEFGGDLVMISSASADATVEAVWSFDGTTFTEQLAAPPAPRSLTVAGGDLYLTGRTGADLLASDGPTFTPIATGALTDVYALVEFADTLYFGALTGADYRLHRVEGGVVVPIPGSPESPFAGFAHDGALWFQGADAEGNTIAFRYDGAAVTPLGGPARYPVDWTPFAGELYFVAYDGPASETGALFRVALTTDPALAPSGLDVTAPLLVTGVLLALGATLLARRRRVAP